MSFERNKAIVRRLFDEVWNAGSLDAIAELYAADYVADYRPYAPLRRGHEAIKGMVQRTHAALSRLARRAGRNDCGGRQGGCRPEVSLVWKLTVGGQLVDHAWQILGELGEQVILRGARPP